MHGDITAYMQDRFATTEREVVLVEYSLLLALIALASLVALAILGDRASSDLAMIGGAQLLR
jgi:Flp pilus assembly pilin Flp